jgi:hypothetical protein
MARQRTRIGNVDHGLKNSPQIAVQQAAIGRAGNAEDCLGFFGNGVDLLVGHDIDLLHAGVAQQG